MIDELITVVIPTSPIRKHPDTSMIEKTIDLVRQQLPTSQILILADGVRKEQEYLQEQYAHYLVRLFNLIYLKNNIRMEMFDPHMHQSGMMYKAFQEDMIKTPLLLYIEHDFPIVGKIPWKDITDILIKDQADLVRFYWEPFLIPEHKHLFLDQQAYMLGKVPVIRTGQWSQRPHIARTEFYKEMIMSKFTDKSKTFIEDGVHGYYGSKFVKSPKRAWSHDRLCIYYPEGNISRCDHLDGRGEEIKYELIP